MAWQSPLTSLCHFIVFQTSTQFSHSCWLVYNSILWYLLSLSLDTLFLFPFPSSHTSDSPLSHCFWLHSLIPDLAYLLKKKKHVHIDKGELINKDSSYWYWQEQEQMLLEFRIPPSFSPAFSIVIGRVLTHGLPLSHCSHFSDVVALSLPPSFLWL